MGDLLTKFDSVSIAVDNRITPADRKFCELNQAAYEAAILSYQELSYYWQDMENKQDEYKNEIIGKYRHDYLHSDDGPRISADLIRKHIHALHADYIRHITFYFRDQYKITVKDADIVQALVPKEPEYRLRGDNSEHDAYLKTMQDMRVRYQDVVDQIMLRLDGRGLTEQAFYELRRKCQDAAYWANEKHEARFERKKDVICFKESFCAWRGLPYNDWNIYDKTKDLVKGLAHFETGSFDTFPDGMSQLIGWSGLETDVMEFPSCNKLKQIKLYKKGRIDVRFTSGTYAEEFIGKYLAAA